MVESPGAADARRDRWDHHGPVLRLRAFVSAAHVDEVRDALGAARGVSHVEQGQRTTDGLVSVTADVEVDAADATIELLDDFDIAWNDVMLWRVPGIRPFLGRQGVGSTERDGAFWAEVVDRAHDNSELRIAYALFMAAAGVIAGVGVLTGSSVLIVGAMAISPDLLPISASAIGIVERRWQLAMRGSRAVVGGLGIGTLAACGATLLLRIGNRIPDDLVLADTVLGPSLTQIGPGSLLVAAAAGMAGMLAFERAGSAAVGVAISVTTIPAAAYVGAAIALGRSEPMWGAALVLVSNIVVIVTACTATLWVQRRRLSVTSSKRGSST